MKTKLIFIALISLIFSNCKNKLPLKNQTKQDYLFKKLTPEATGISFRNEIKDDVKHNIINYIYYYNGDGVSVGDFNNENLPDLFFVSNKVDNKL